MVARWASWTRWAAASARCTTARSTPGLRSSGRRAPRRSRSSKNRCGPPAIQRHRGAGQLHAPFKQSQVGEHPPKPQRSPSTLHAMPPTILYSDWQMAQTSVDASTGRTHTPKPESSEIATSPEAPSKTDPSDAGPLSVDASPASRLSETSDPSETSGSRVASAIPPLQPSPTHAAAARADRLNIPNGWPQSFRSIACPSSERTVAQWVLVGSSRPGAGAPSEAEEAADASLPGVSAVQGPPARCRYTRDHEVFRSRLPPPRRPPLDGACPPNRVSTRRRAPGVTTTASPVEGRAGASASRPRSPPTRAT